MSIVKHFRLKKLGLCIAYKRKGMLEERGLRQTQKSDLQAYRDELIATSGQREEADDAVADAAAAGREERAAPWGSCQQERAAAGHRGEVASGQQKGKRTCHQQAQVASGQHRGAASSNHGAKRKVDEDTSDGASDMLEHVSANSWSATAFQLILDLVKKWWLAGFAARMVNGQLAIAYPLASPRRFISALASHRHFIFTSASHWHWIQREVRIETPHRGRTHYHLLVALDH